VTIASLSEATERELSTDRFRADIRSRSRAALGPVAAACVGTAETSDLLFLLDQEFP
jgi:hypothetical protein